uniref:(California timema) hypothetical protein n=1 Tax=Timema californicum TaxID=61474 RepID=A0A7R9PAJ3_TIMCA|nr:unnamed protein product [Timema californicum]
MFTERTLTTNWPGVPTETVSKQTSDSSCPKLLFYSETVIRPELGIAWWKSWAKFSFYLQDTWNEQTA